MYEKHKHEFGDFMQAAMKLSKLGRETGKTYRSLITHYEKTVRLEKELRKDEEELKLRVRNLKEEYETAAKNLKNLNEKSNNAHKVLNRLSRTKLELATYGLSPRNFETVKVFPSEIRRLGGNPAKAVEILKKISSLEDKLQEKIMSIVSRNSSTRAWRRR